MPAIFSDPYVLGWIKAISLSVNVNKWYTCKIINTFRQNNSPCWGLIQYFCSCNGYWWQSDLLMPKIRNNPIDLRPGRLIIKPQEILSAARCRIRQIVSVVYQQFKCCGVSHDDVIKWKHFPRYWPFVWGIHRSPVNSPHKGQWRGALMFTLICARINGWVNTREAGDLRRHRTHYDVTVMCCFLLASHIQFTEPRRLRHVY